MKGLTIPAFLSGLSALIRVGASQCFDGSTTYQEALSVPPSVVQYSSCGHAADGPKVYPIDAVSYDWWYFDAVSSDGKEALTVIFFTASPAGFPSLASVPNPLNVAIAGTFANGTTAGGSALATSVTVDVVGNGASGNWTDSGCAFTGTPDLSRYVVTVGNPSLGISGTLELVSRGPGHYPCSPLVGGANELLIPHVGWVNVMPAADATVDFNFGGSEMRFHGNGYHDKNWGDTPFSTAVQSWYWGHGTLGEYQLVWFDAIDSLGRESVSGYALQHGQVVGSTCAHGGLAVRPVGAPYPPTLLTSDPTQFTIVMDLEHGGVLNATVTALNRQVAEASYSRWLGSIAGTVNGAHVSSSGSALWEQFKLVA